MSLRHAEYRLASWLSRRLPAASAFGLAERLADIRWRSAARERAIVQANLSVIAGSRPAEQATLAREVFRNFGRYVVEFFNVHRVAHPEVEVEGYEHLLSAQRARRGVIVLTGHLGNWELGGVLIQRMGFPVSVVALPHQDPRMDRLFNRQRERCGLKIIPLGSGAAHRSLQRLRDGELLGVLGDWEFNDAGLAISLCDRQVMLPRGPAILSLRGRSPIVPTFLIREGMWKFRLCFEPPIWPERPVRRVASMESSVRSLCQRFAHVLERYLQRFPAQWLMFQPSFEFRVLCFESQRETRNPQRETVVG